MSKMRVKVRARAVSDAELEGRERPMKSVPSVEPGFVTLELEVRDLIPAETKVLHDLFPHGYNDIERLLANEALLAAYVP